MQLIDYSKYVFDALQLSRYHGLDFFKGCEIHKSTKYSLTKDNKKKIVLVDWMSTKEKHPDFSWADLVISATTEMIGGEDVNILMSQNQSKFNNSNVIHLINGADILPAMFDLQGFLNNARIFFPFNYFFVTVAAANDPVIYTEAMMKHRRYLFEALLGTKKSARSYVFYKLRDFNLLDQSLINLTSNVPGANEFNKNPEILNPWNGEIPKDYRSHGLNELDNLENTEVHTSTVCQPETRAYKNESDFPLNIPYPRLSEIIPEKVYQNSWYSLITETNLGLECRFITEKTVKALFSQRIFIFFGPWKHLEHLRILGFKTFDGLIDESYDSEWHHCIRFEMAWKQVRRLLKRNPADIYREARPILEHNFNHARDIKTLMTPAYDFVRGHIGRL